MISQLVVNGCSYMETYASGGGHIDLAAKLGIPTASTLAMGGSANSRILRTTMKHSHQTTVPTLYVLGLTFVSRAEIPICKDKDEHNSFEGRWINPQNQEYSDRWEHFWSKKESEKFVEMKLMTEAYSLLDRTEDLMYNMLAVIADLTSRGHKVLMFQQADDSYESLLTSPKLQLLGKSVNILGGFKWKAIEFQHQQGVAVAPPGGVANFIGPKDIPEVMKHRASGAHEVLNSYLTTYITTNGLL